MGLFAIQSAFLLGAERVLAIDRVAGRLRIAREVLGAETIDYEDDDLLPALEEATGGRGPDACIDAVGMEAHAPGLHGLYDEIKQRVRLQTDRPSALRLAIQACGKGGTVSVPGVYGGLIDKFPMGAVFGKGLTLRTGQTHVHRLMRPLLEKVRAGEIDPTFVISHELPLREAPRAYERFKNDKETWTKVVLTP